MSAKPMLIAVLVAACACGASPVASAPAEAEQAARVPEISGSPAALLPDEAVADDPLPDDGAADDRVVDDRPADDLPEPPSAADRLRSDPVQTATVPDPPPPVKLSGEERAIARHIAKAFRLENDSIEQFVHYAFKAAREFKLDPHLILAVIAVESGFDPKAQSKAGAQGLMQVHTRVHADKFEAFGGPDAAYDPLANIRVGARILSEYVKSQGDVAAALKSYVGAAFLDSDNGYVVKVMGRLAEFDAAVGRKAAATKEAKADTIEQPAGSIGVGVEKGTGAGRVGM